MATFAIVSEHKESPRKDRDRLDCERIATLDPQLGGPVMHCRPTPTPPLWDASVGLTSPRCFVPLPLSLSIPSACVSPRNFSGHKEAITQTLGIYILRGTTQICFILPSPLLAVGSVFTVCHHLKWKKAVFKAASP